MIVGSDSSIPWEVFIPLMTTQFTGLIALAVLMVRLRERVAKLEEHVHMLNGKGGK